MVSKVAMTSVRIWKRVQFGTYYTKTMTVLASRNKRATEVQPHSQFPLLIIIEVLVELKHVWSSSCNGVQEMRSDFREV